MQTKRADKREEEEGAVRRGLPWVRKIKPCYSICSLNIRKDTREYVTVAVNPRKFLQRLKRFILLVAQSHKTRRTKQLSDIWRVCTCFSKQKKTFNINHCIGWPSQSDYSTKFTHSSPQSSSISSVGDKEVAEDNAVFPSPASLTLQHWLNVIDAGHLSDTQHSVSFARKAGFKTLTKPL